MWINWEQLRCVTLSIVIVGFTKEFLTLIGTCNLRTICALGSFACSKKNFLFGVEWSSMFSMFVHRSGVQCFPGKTNKLISSDIWSKTNILEVTQKFFVAVIGDVFCPGRHFVWQKCAHIETFKRKRKYQLRKSATQNVLSRFQNSF